METLKQFKTFIEEITSNNSKNYKLDVLRKYKNNKSVKFYLNYIYNPYIVTGIGDKEIEKIKSLHPDHYIVLETATVFEMLKYISMYNTGAENYLETMKDFIDRILPEEYQELFFKILSKNIQLGLDPKSINKIIPGCIKKSKNNINVDEYKEKYYNLKLCEYELLFLYNLLRDSKPQVVDIVDKLQKIIDKNFIVNWMDPKRTDQEEQLIKEYFKAKGE